MTVLVLTIIFALGVMLSAAYIYGNQRGWEERGELERTLRDDQ